MAEQLSFEKPFEKPPDDYLRVMTASPGVTLADPAENLYALTEMYKAARDRQAELLVLPELSLTGYTTADLFFNSHVLERTDAALQTLKELTAEGPAMAVGAPLEVNGLLYNCAFLLADGQIKGIVPKSYLPNYNEFYEKRWFTSGRDIRGQTVLVGEETVPFGTDLLFNINGTKVGVEICEDAFAPIPPSAEHTLAGAEVIINLSASNELIGKTEYRRRLIAGHAGSLVCAYVYSSAGKGESVADVIYGGHQMIAELGKIHTESLPLNGEGSTVFDIDRSYIRHDRLVNKTYADQAAEFRNRSEYRIIETPAGRPNDNRLLRDVNPAPFVPSSNERLDERCEELFEMMSRPLAQNLLENNSGGIVIGLSGGLDSTLALLTAMIAAQNIGRGADFIHTLTMPGPASSERTQANARRLAKALGTTHQTIPIHALFEESLRSIGHDGVTQDIAYENTQARIRKGLLENYANRIGGLDLGTGDMSEAALGWCTFNGDHMSMRNQNASVPKTLVKHLVRWYAERRADPTSRQLLLDILDTPISPELTGNGNLSQQTEDAIGPYELHDFFLYELMRYGSRPAKIGYLATKAFTNYDEPTIRFWLETFLERFTKSQWKRDAQPNGTKYGTVSLSQRGDLRMAPNTGPNWWR